MKTIRENRLPAKLVDLRLSPVLLTLVLLLPVELFNRAQIEYEMKAYVSMQESYLMKRWRQKKIEKLLARIPTPIHYRRMVETATIQRLEN